MTEVTLRAISRDKSAKGLQRSDDVTAVAFETELGWMALAHRAELLLGTVFGHASQRQAIESLRRCVERGPNSAHYLDVLEIEEQPRSIADLIKRLTAYAVGEAVDFSDVRVDDRHLTDFGRRIVKACRRIPRGKSRSYGQLAADCGSPGAARAVGQVMAKNRFPLVVPCHRVLAAGGRIGGFSAPQGLLMKRRLLELESATAWMPASRR